MPELRLVIPGTKLSVSRLCLGGNRLGSALDQTQSFALLDAFVAEGGNFIDTAHIYADWLPDCERSCSEKTIGRWLKSRGYGDMVVATKGGHPKLGAPGVARLDSPSLRMDALASLANLGLDQLDIFYLHRDDPTRPAEEILADLEQLRGEGLIRHYAASNWSALRLAEATAAAERRGWQGFVANQPEWSFARRNAGAADLVAMDNAMLHLHKASGLAVIPYSSQAGGYFDKLMAGRIDPPTAALYDNPANHATGAFLADAARHLNATPTQLMLAALMQSPFVTIPVVGCRTLAQLHATFKSLDVETARLPQAMQIKLAQMLHAR